MAEGPLVDFEGTPTSGGKPLTVSFTEQCSPTPYRCIWDFGDGVTASGRSLRSTTHVYNSTGNPFSVTLTGYFFGYSPEDASRTKEDYINYNIHSALFTGSPLYGDDPLYVSFTSLCTGSPYSYLWDFGDGETSNTADYVVHAYHTSSSGPMIYDVSLTAYWSNPTEVDTITKEGYVVTATA